MAWQKVGPIKSRNLQSIPFLTWRRPMTSMWSCNLEQQKVISLIFTILIWLCRIIKIFHGELDKSHDPDSMILKWTTLEHVLEANLAKGFEILENVGLNPEQVNKKLLTHNIHILHEDWLPGWSDDTFLYKCWTFDDETFSKQLSNKT